MGVKSFIKKSVAFVSVLAMACSMVVMPAGASYAAEANDNVKVNKTAELQNDGTYKITLESWAEGTASTTTNKSGVPLDIVLVLDQSGSMSGNVNTLKQSVTSFVNTISKNAKEYNVDHRIAIAGYASNETDGKSDGGTISSGSSSSSWINTGLFVNGKLKNYETPSGYSEVYSSDLNTSNTYYIYGGYQEITYNGSNWGYYDRRGNWTSITPKTSSRDWRNTQVYERTGGSLTAQDYKDSLVNVNTDGSITSSITTAINNIAASGATRTQYGMEMANKVFENNPLEEGSNRRRIVVVFTDGQPGYSGFDSTEANNAISKAYTAKNTYGATVYTLGFYSKAGDNVTNFMKYLSSNYPDAQNMSDYGTKAADKYYMTTSNSSELEKIFTNISEDIVSGDVQTSLSDKSIVRDILSDNFDLPSNFDEEKDIKVYTSTCTTYDENGNHKWGALNELENASVSVDKDNETIDVSGFAYDKEYITPKLVTGRDDLGKKLVVIISNVVANKSGLELDTNKPESAIYNPVEGGEDEFIKAFPQPKVDIPNHSYVLDYGKSVVSDTIQNDCGISKVNYYNTVKPSPYEENTAGNYGTFDLTNVSNGGTITYTPGKINWDGFDSAYVFGAVGENEYLWSAVNFIPATCVYYEDDFALTTNTDKDSNVSIVWSDGWNSETDNENSKDNSQSNTNSQYGWDENYEDDTQSSNGSSHWTETSKATATFRFTGTAVDVYSRTNKDVGRIMARIKKVNSDGTTTGIKTKTIDNISESSGEGSYYQIPTLFFDGLDYGTYEVTITVNPIKDSEGNVVRARYYLDGVRVYHPLNPDKLDPIASEAYEDAGESNAKYITLRNGLIDSTTSTEITSKIEGSVFIDKSDKQVADETNIIGTYKDYGPKNEVYLAENNGVAFTVDGYDSTTDKVFVGLKSITGKVTTVNITGEKEPKAISSAADLYYEVKPDSNGNVVIKNNTKNLLSVTKVRITTKSAQNTRMLVATPQLMSYAANFEISEDDNQTDTDLDKDDVVIDNPSEDDNNETEETPSISIWQQIINSLNKWFGR